VIEINKRLDRIEERLFKLEQNAGLVEAPPVQSKQRTAAIGPEQDIPAAPESPEQTTTETIEAVAISTAPGPTAAAASGRRRVSSASVLMAWGASASFLLAATYFVLLAIESGWLTPIRQLLIAIAFGLGMIGAGVWLSSRDRQYAAYLPAIGVSILYLSVYAGHLFYELIPTKVATVTIAVISLIAVGLGRRLGNSAYTLLAAIAVYLTPILMHVRDADLIGIVIYFTTWSLLFSFFALQEQRRATYLVALYLALICFDATWRIAGTEQWLIASVYQMAQFLIFITTAITFSILYRQPMNDSDAALHGLPLFYFYLLEFVLLKQHAPDVVAVAAFASVVVVIAAFWFARGRIRDPDSMSAAAALVSTYSTVVTAHVIFGELLPTKYLAWGALILPTLLAFLARQLDWSKAVAIPIMLVSGVLFVAGLLQTLVFDSGPGAVAMPNLLLVLYAMALYLSYVLMRSSDSLHSLGPVALYLGHLVLMVVTVRSFESGLAISITWAVYAVACLLIALRLKDTHLGQSSLLIFTASAVKVLLYDLADSGSIIRIVTLMVLGASLYTGGWLYQSLARSTAPYHPDPVINDQIRLIHELTGQGFEATEIVRYLIEHNVPCRKAGGWSEDLVSQIRRDYPR
jgi:uncharacterized membrane protein